MLQRWTERVPPLRGDVTMLREVAAADAYTLFTLFSDPAVTAYKAPPPPTLAKFAGFVEWSHQEREQGHGLCFAIVPDGMTAAVGILQVRSLDPTSSSAEWGFVLSAHFWSTGVFFDAANVLVEFAFTAMHVDRLEARIALRNRRAHAAVRKLGARSESTLATSSPRIFRAIQSWCGPCAKTTGGTGRAIVVCQPTTRANGSGKRSTQRRACCAEASYLRPSNPIHCSCLTVAGENEPGRLPIPRQRI
jgi:ribosomal-protein-alanine N-acetyltransferase